MSDLNSFPHVQPFGTALPLGEEHNTTVSMPTVEDVEDYERGVAAALAKMQGGYPRFRDHPYYVALCQRYRHLLSPGEALRLFPSKKVAQGAVDYAGAGRVIVTPHGVTAAIVPAPLATRLKQYWQHGGETVSSRFAKAILDNDVSYDPRPAAALREKIAAHYGVAADDVYLSPTGMGSSYHAMQAVASARPGQTVQFGFPYLDNLKVQERLGPGCDHLPFSSPADFDGLRDYVSEFSPAGFFVELTSNPLSDFPDPRELKNILARRGIPLVADSTLAPPCNVDLSPYADMQTVSLTKFMSGLGNVMGGAVILNSASRHYAAFKKYFNTQFEHLLYPGDADALSNNIDGFEQRMGEINANAEALYDYLSRHPLIKRVYYPKGNEAYESLRKKGGGYGGLLSFEFKDPALARLFYNNLKLAKGPSLGTDFTLLCPYTLLAHFDELDWAESHGVNRHLLRMSVGRENIKEIIARFDAAFDSLPRSARLDPAQSRHARAALAPGRA